MKPERILIRREQRKLHGACADCMHVAENYKNLGVAACEKQKPSYKKDKCGEFSYNQRWDS